MDRLAPSEFQTLKVMSSTEWDDLDVSHRRGFFSRGETVHVLRGRDHNRVPPLGIVNWSFEGLSFLVDDKLDRKVNGETCFSCGLVIRRLFDLNLKTYSWSVKKGDRLIAYAARRSENSSSEPVSLQIGGCLEKERLLVARITKLVYQLWSTHIYQFYQMRYPFPCRESFTDGISLPQCAVNALFFFSPSTFDDSSILLGIDAYDDTWATRLTANSGASKWATVSSRSARTSLLSDASGMSSYYSSVIGDQLVCVPVSIDFQDDRSGTASAEGRQSMPENELRYLFDGNAIKWQVTHVQPGDEL